MTERRLTRRGRETRERILAAAAELMFDRGVAETTLEDIRAAAGVSGSQVYHYFADKQALVRAVIDHQADAVLGTQGTYLDHLDTVAGLRAWRDLLVDHQRTLECRGGCPLGTLGAELAEIDDAARMAVARGFGRWEAKIGDGLRAMHTRGDLPAETDPDELALAMLAALQGGLLLAQVRRDPRPLAVALDAMIDRIQGLTEGFAAPGHRGHGRARQDAFLGICVPPSAGGAGSARGAGFFSAGSSCSSPQPESLPGY